MGQEAWASAPWRTNFPPPGAQDNQQAMEHAVGAASRRLPPSCLLVATRRSHPGSSTCIDEKKRQHEVTEVNTLLHCKFLPLRLGWPPWPPLFSTCTSSMQRSRALGVWPVSALLCSADVVLTADRWRRSIPAADSMLCARRWQVPKAAPLLARDNGSARDARRHLLAARHVRDARGHPAASQGGQVTQLQAPGAYFRQHAATRSGAGLKSPSRQSGSWQNQ